MLFPLLTFARGCACRPQTRKYLHAVKDDNFRSATHELHECHKLADDMCRYDLDDLDTVWLSKLNEERDAMGEKRSQKQLPRVTHKILLLAFFKKKWIVKNAH